MLPFFFVMCAMLIILVLFPPLALWSVDAFGTISIFHTYLTAKKAFTMPLNVRVLSK